MAANVTNAVFVLDLSCGVRDWEFVLPLLYPGDDVVDWAFFNLFQSHKQATPAKPPQETRSEKPHKHILPSEELQESLPSKGALAT